MFILNPISGQGKKNNLEELIRQFIGGHHITIIETTHAGHAEEIAKSEMLNYDAIIAVGGDGTVNEIAKILAGSNCALGIIPVGSGNGLARHLKIPLNAKSAIERIAAFESDKYDTGSVNNEFFVGTCGFGFDGFIAEEFDQHPKRGFLSYAKLVAANYTKYEPSDYIVTINGQTFERTALLCSVANSSQFGNGFTISPESNMQDGQFELVFIYKFPLLETPLIGAKFFTQKIGNSKYYESFQFSDEISIEVPSRSRVYYHVDGEPKQNETKFSIQVRPQNLLIL